MRPMARTAASPSFIILISTLILLLFVCRASAQGLPTLGSNPGTNNALPETDQTTATETTRGSTEATTTGRTTGRTTGSATTGSTGSTTAAATTDSKSSDSKETDSKTTDRTTSSSGAKITPTDTASTTSSRTKVPPKISGSGQSAGDLPKDLPTLAGQYPAPSVPPTQNAPFMQHSSLPEGTVFIIVGAALGFFGLTVLAWRGFVAWSLHRSVKRAAMQQNMADSKSLLRPNKAGGVYATRQGSSLSLDQLARPGSHHPRAPGATNSGLFFSPTARPGSTANDSPVNRSSQYLPAGYYAPGNSAPSGGAGMTHVGGAGSGGGINLSNLGPQSQGYSRARSTGPSPPVSPNLPPARGGGDPGYGRVPNAPHGHNPSASSLNLNAAPQGRAPSAYLEDLFESHQMQPGTGHQNRY
ncbi:MAG: hypothetical protein M1832_004102 [Thelocarpon impressellum]|nr:MAG: hypothetical protein M1832_004102 [Thelocarpon impressellum]